MKNQTEQALCVFLVLFMMNKALGVAAPYSSNGKINGSSNHKHRHHHNHHHETLRDDLSHSMSLSASEKPVPVIVNNTINDHFNRHVAPLQDDGIHEGVSELPDRQSVPATSTSAPSSADVFSHHHPLIFQKRQKNTTIAPTTAKPPHFHIHSNTMARKNNINSQPPDYQDSDFIPFNPDKEFKSPHLKYPQRFHYSDSNQNRTLSSIHGGFSDPFEYTPWELPPDHSINQYSSTTSRFIFLNPFHSTNITKSGFSPNEVHVEIDYIVPNLNFSTIYESGYNTSINEEGGASSDDLYTWSILMMAPLVLFGMGGNTLVILAISLEKRLQNVTNYFLLSLAVTDLLVSIIVMPFSIINVFTGRWLFGLLLCDFFVTSDVLMCTSSILHLCTISLERYIGIRYPLWTKYKSKRIVLLKIVFVWTIALAITSPITVLGVVREENVLVAGECVLSNPYFIIYGSTFAFFIPLTIMVLMYVLTVRMLNKQALLCQSRRAGDREGQPVMRRSTSRKNWKSRRKYYGRATFSTGSSSSGARFVDDVTLALTDFRQNSYRTTGVVRHNTIPVGHYRYNEFTRKEVAGNSNGSYGGSNSSLHRGRSNITVGSSNSYICSSVDGNSFTTTSGRGSGRRKRYSSQNGTGNAGYGTVGCGYGTVGMGYEAGSNGYGTCSADYAGIKSSTDFQYAKDFQEEESSDLPSDAQNYCSRLSSSSSSSSPPTSSTNREPRRNRETSRKNHVAVKAASILLMKRDNSDQSQGPSPTHVLSARASVRRDNSVRTEQKASKVLGVVFMIFVICWAPFFTVNILTAVCASCKFESTLVTAFVWLGYVSSTLNPIIYTIFNNIFRITFIKLLCCRYKLLHRARRSSTLPSARNGLLNFSEYSPAHHSTTTTMNTTSSTYVDESNC